MELRKDEEKNFFDAVEQLKQVLKEEMPPAKTPAEISALTEKAEQGCVDEQALLGFFYFTGNGVLQSFEDAYFWLTLASTVVSFNNSPELYEAMDEVASHLTPQKISDIQKRAAEWKPTPETAIDNVSYLSHPQKKKPEAENAPEQFQAKYLSSSTTTGGDMLMRLGNVLYWIGCTIAALLAIGGVIAKSNGSADDWGIFVVFEIAAVIAWLAGKGCRYILSGK